MGAIPAREYLNGEYRMALAYLLCPTFQIVNSAGKPATGGYLEVYLAGSRTKYFCSSDFDGTRHPFQIPLDSLGSNVVLADDSNRYDVYVYNRYGTLLMSRYNVSPGADGGGAGFGVLTSSDGSVTIVETANGYDLTVNVPEPSVLRAGADALTSDGQFVFHELVRDGDKITVDDTGKIRLEQGWYHYDITVRIVWDTGAPVNKTVPLQLYTTLASDVLDFDASYSHNDTVRLSGETKIATSGSELVFGISGLEPGMGAELVDMGVHAIYVSFGEESNYQAGDYIDISPDKVISVTGVQPQSAMTAYAPIVSLSSYVPTADFTSYSSDVNSAITSLSSDISSVGTDISSISSMVSGLTGVYLEQSASSLFAPSSLETSKLDASASSSFAQASSLSGYIPTGESSKYQQTAGMTAYVPYSSVEGTGGHVTGINGSAIAGAAGHEYSGISPIVVDNTAETISIQTTGLAVDADTMSAWVSGDDVVIGVKPGAFFSSLPVSAKVGNDSAYYGLKSAQLRDQYNGVDVMPNEVRLWYMGYSASVDYSAIKKWNSAVDTVSANSASWTGVDSATVSAIASGYVTGKQDISGMSAYAYESSNSAKLDKTAQIVTATATQLYAGTAYLTSVNGAPVSASRAGNAANATFANSAWYDGTGRFISALPDSATVSAIASAYTTGKQDTLTFSYDDDKISAINGSALAGQGGGGATGDYVEKSATEVAIGSDNNATTYSFAQGRSNSASSYSFTQGYINEASSYSLVQGYINQASSNSFAQGSQNKASYNSFAQGNRNSANSDSFAQGERNSANAYSFAQGYRNSASYWSFAQGSGISAKNTVAVFGLNNLHGDGDTATGDSAAFAIGDGTASGARHDLMVVTKDGEITMYSSTADTTGTGIMSAIRAISAAATGGGGIDSATCSAIASSYAESAASSKLDSSAISAYVPFSAISADENSAITSINGSSVGGAQVVTATGSANLNGTGINTINGSSIFAKSLSGAGILVGSSDPGMYLTGGNNGGTAYYKSNELVINRSGYGETIKFNLGSAGSQIYGSAAGTRGAFMQMSNDSHTAFFGALSGGDAKIELDGYSAGSANMAGWDSSWNTVSSNSSTWGAVTSKMDSTAVQSAYASASASQATAQGVLYILIPDGV